MNKVISNKNIKGFTLIELLVVISVVGILSAFLVRVINIEHHKNDAEDAVKIANISKLAEGLDAYMGAEGEFPADTDSATLDPYMQWISGFTYVPHQEGTNPIDSYGIYIESSLHPEDYITYFSSSGEILLCGDIIDSSFDQSSCGLSF